MAALANLVRYLAPANLAASLHLHHRRRVPARHVLPALALAAILATVYYLHLSLFAPSDHVLSPPQDSDWSRRAAHVKLAFQHAYHAYERHAFPHDELMPLTNGSVDNFNGWGVSIVDSLDTMLLMGLQDEYSRALPVISNTNFSLPSNNYVPFFETVIRYLGGLLGAYAISGDDLLRQKADELGTKLAPAFNTPSGFPGYAVDTYRERNLSFISGVLAEIASCQMEYAYLGKITGKKEHVDHATLITNLFYAANLSDTGGMYPTRWNLFKGTPSGLQLSVGAPADSGHENTLKQFLLTARTDKRNLEMYLRFSTYVINNLLFLTPKRHLLYATDVTKLKRSFMPSHSVDHLSCFFPGLLALGAHLLPLDNLDTLGINFTALADGLLPEDRRAYAKLAEFNLADLHMWAAEGIAQTCYLLYADQPTGLAPDNVRMDVDPEVGETRWIDALHAWKAGESDGQSVGWGALGRLWGRRPAQQRSPPGVGDVNPWTSPLYENVTVEALVRPARSKGKGPDTFGRDYLIKNTGYYLRPETIESFYILWRTTGDVKWRQRGWHVFQAIERFTKSDLGYTSIDNVHTAYPIRLDSMPSYFLAETLKYLYLLFSDEDPISLEEWVFTTEAHALPVFEWSRQEREAYGIP